MKKEKETKINNINLTSDNNYELVYMCFSTLLSQFRPCCEYYLALNSRLGYLKPQALCKSQAFSAKLDFQITHCEGRP